jgi:hypothetical protein
VLSKISAAACNESFHSLSVQAETRVLTSVAVGMVGRPIATLPHGRVSADKLLDTNELNAIKFYKGNRTFPNPL